MLRKKQLLIVAHAPSDNTRALLAEVLSGAAHPDIQGVTAAHIPPLEAGPEDVLAADGIILGTTENFGYMSGALKDFFDRCYYPCLEKTRGLPYALYIRAGLDGTGTRIAVSKIVSGLGWKAVQEAAILQGEFQQEFRHRCRDLGTLMAAGLEADIF